MSAKRPFKIKLADKAISDLFSQVPDDSDAYHELASMRIARGKEFTAGTGSNTFNLMNQTDESFVKQIVERIQWYISYGPFLTLSVQWQQPLLKSIVKQLSLKLDGDHWMRVSEILPIFKLIVDLNNIDERILFAQMNEYTPQLEDMLNEDDLKDIIPNLSVYKVAFEIENELSTLIRKTATDYIQSLDVAAWKEAYLDESSYVFKLLHLMFRTETLKSMPAHALDAYKQMLLSVAGEEDFNLETTAGWKELYRKTDKRQIKSTIKNIRDEFLNSTDITPEKFLFFETMLRLQGDLKDRAGDAVRRILNLVVSDDDCRQLIAEKRDFYTPLIAQASDDKYDFIRNFKNGEPSNPDNTTISLFWQDLEALESELPEN